jgi:hypothetical protein
MNNDIYFTGNLFFLQTSVKYDIALVHSLIMLKCHFIVRASNDLTSVREVISAKERP